MSSLLSPPAIISLLIALTIHESAHAWVAYKLGDPTAKYNGRVSLNPLVHLDPVGTVVFAISLMGGVPFGWAKPVPVDLSYLRHPKRDGALIALAGPASNLILAFIAMIGLVFITPSEGVVSFSQLLQGSGPVVTAFFMQLLASSLFINLGLMAFNLLPIAPLDGSKVLAFFIPLRYEEQYYTYLQYGMHILIGLIILDGFLHIPILSWWFQLIVSPFLMLFLAFI